MNRELETIPAVSSLLEAPVSRNRQQMAFKLARFSQPLATASLRSLAIFTAGAGLSYLAQLVVARATGAENFGIYAYVLAWVTLLAYLSTLGFYNSLLRFIPAYRADSDWQSVRGVIQFARRRTLAAGLAIVIAGWLVVLLLKGSMRPELATTFFIGLLAVPVIGLQQVNASIMRAFGGIMRAIGPERILRDGFLLIIVAGVAWFNLLHPDARFVMTAALVCGILVLAVQSLFVVWAQPPELMMQAGSVKPEEWYRPALPLMVTIVADNLMNRSGIIVLGVTGNTSEAGILAVAMSMSLLTGLPKIAVATAFAPKVSELHARLDQLGLRKLAGKATILTAIGTLAIALPLLLFSSLLLSLFGKDFAGESKIVSILVAGQILSAIGGPQQQIITMTGNERSGAIMLSLCAICNFVACLLTVSSAGVAGAAWAMTGSLVTWTILMSIFIYHRLGLTPGILYAASYFKAR